MSYSDKKIKVSKEKLFEFLDKKILKEGNFGNIHIGVYNGVVSSFKFEQSINLKAFEDTDVGTDA